MAAPKSNIAVLFEEKIDKGRVGREKHEGNIVAKKMKHQNGSKGQGLICHLIAYLFYISVGLQASGGDVALGAIAPWHNIPAYDSMTEMI